MGQSTALVIRDSCLCPEGESWRINHEPLARNLVGQVGDHSKEMQTRSPAGTLAIPGPDTSCRRRECRHGVLCTYRDGCLLGGVLCLPHTPVVSRPESEGLV